MLAEISRGFLIDVKKHVEYVFHGNINARNKENYNRRCKRWNHNDFCLKTKFSLAIKLHYCAEECELCDREDDIEEEDYEGDEDVVERGKQKW
uniref:ShKT domain-containing protein n=1 Tax=Meloidogyne incognita TaxID=6306 RepID=A0A914P590_MELIC